MPAAVAAVVGVWLQRGDVRRRKNRKGREIIIEATSNEARNKKKLRTTRGSQHAGREGSTTRGQRAELSREIFGKPAAQRLLTVALGKKAQGSLCAASSPLRKEFAKKRAYTTRTTFGTARHAPRGSPSRQRLARVVLVYMSEGHLATLRNFSLAETFTAERADTISTSTSLIADCRKEKRCLSDFFCSIVVGLLLFLFGPICKCKKNKTMLP